MAVIGPVEILIFLLVAAALVFFVFRRRVPALPLVLIVILLSPVVAMSILLFVGALTGALASF